MELKTNSSLSELEFSGCILSSLNSSLKEINLNRLNNIILIYMYQTNLFCFLWYQTEPSLISIGFAAKLELTQVRVQLDLKSNPTFMHTSNTS